MKTRTTRGWKRLGRLALTLAALLLLSTVGMAETGSNVNIDHIHNLFDVVLAGTYYFDEALPDPYGQLTYHKPPYISDPGDQAAAMRDSGAAGRGEAFVTAFEELGWDGSDFFTIYVVNDHPDEPVETDACTIRFCGLTPEKTYYFYYKAPGEDLLSHRQSGAAGSDGKLAFSFTATLRKKYPNSSRPRIQAQLGPYDLLLTTDAEPGPTHEEGTPTPDTTATLYGWCSEGGVLTPPGTINVEKGTDFTYTVAPAQGYHVAKIEAEGKTYTQNLKNSYTFKDIQRDGAVYFYLEKGPAPEVPNPNTGR